MQADQMTRDSLESRPLPKWLTDQKEGKNRIQPREMEMKEDHSLIYSLIFTGIFIFVTVAALTFIILRRKKKNSA